MMMGLLKRILLTAVIASISACAAPRAYVHPEADLGFYRRIGVAQFQSLTDDPRAGQKVQRVFTTELLKKGGHDVIAPGQFAKVETEIRGQLSLSGDIALDSVALQTMGAKAGVQGILTGVVRDYRMERVGQDEFPMISFSLQLIDAPTGRIVWDISLGERGGPKFPVLAIGETHTLDELTTKLCRRALGTLK